MTPLERLWEPVESLQRMLGDEHLGLSKVPVLASDLTLVLAMVKSAGGMLPLLSRCEAQIEGGSTSMVAAWNFRKALYAISKATDTQPTPQG